MNFISVTNLTGFVLSAAMLLTSSTLGAEASHKCDGCREHVHMERAVKNVVFVRPASVRTVTTAYRFSLNRLPAGHVSFFHDDEKIFFSEGLYYKKALHGFVLVKPRTGFRVAALPRGHKIIRDAGVTFYSFNNVRYRKAGGLFIVV